MDNLSIQERSKMMSKIRSNNTKPEILLRKALFAKGLRYKINDKKLQGKPDIVLSKYRTVIFVHGCFWHNHKGCKRAHLPKSNVKYWENKIKTNEERDFKNREILEKLGWSVIIIWECELKTKEKIEQAVINLIKNFNF
jgi:DNA mismatch endonuclease (patch repair protein)